MRIDTELLRNVAIHHAEAELLVPSGLTSRMLTTRVSGPGDIQ